MSKKRNGKQNIIIKTMLHRPFPLPTIEYYLSIFPSGSQNIFVPVGCAPLTALSL
jgi:hypothetical protein